MSKQKGKVVEEINFDDTPESEEPHRSLTAAEESAKGFGNSLARQMQKDRLTKLSIYEIEPDLVQPRRVIPTSLRQKVFISPNHMGEVFKLWALEAEIDPMEYWGIEESALPEEEQSSPVKAALIKLIGLAFSIHRDGLINSITVVQGQQGYFIETGERRWFAYHLLNYLFPDDEQWTKITSRVMTEHSRWRQATENNSRDDLNAISKARQYAILMMDLIGITNFLAAHEAEGEQAYYSQVLSHRVPRGENSNIMQAMGFNGRAAVDRHRDLLKLPEDIWLDADDYNIPERVLREVLDKPYETAREMVNDWIHDRRIVSLGDNSKTPVKLPAWFKGIEKLSNQFTPKKLKKLEADERNHLRAFAQNLLANLDAAEREK
jgi:DNA-binding cell septation regulator SpoVG